MKRIFTFALAFIMTFIIYAVVMTANPLWLAGLAGLMVGLFCTAIEWMFERG